MHLCCGPSTNPLAPLMGSIASRKLWPWQACDGRPQMQASEGRPTSSGAAFFLRDCGFPRRDGGFNITPSPPGTPPLLRLCYFCTKFVTVFIQQQQSKWEALGWAFVGQRVHATKRSHCTRTRLAGSKPYRQREGQPPSPNQPPAAARMVLHKHQSDERAALEVQQ